MVTGGTRSAPILQPSCPVSLRSITVTNAGLISQCGSVTTRCTGSHLPPAFQVSAILQPPRRQPLATPGQVQCTTLSPDLALPPRATENTIKRILKASRECAGRKFAAILGAVVDKNAYSSWVRLLCFSAHCLRRPERGGCR